MDERIINLLQKWHARCRRAQIAHHESAARCVHLNYVLGLTVVVLTAAAGSSLLFDFGIPDLGIGIANLVAATFATAHTVLRLAERAERHRSTATGFGEIKREIEQLLLEPQISAKRRQAAIDLIRLKMDYTVGQSPTALKFAWRSAVRQTLEQNKRTTERIYSDEDPTHLGPGFTRHLLPSGGSSSRTPASEASHDLDTTNAGK